MVDVYHEFNYPYEMLGGSASRSSRADGVVFVEYRKEDPNVPIKLVHKMTEAQVKREAASRNSACIGSRRSRSCRGNT